MKLDTLARAHANETRRSASKVRVPPVDVLMRRDRKRRWSARVAVAMSAGLASTAVMVVQGPKTIPHPLLVFRMPERHLLRTPLWQRPRAGVSLFAFEAGRDEAVELRVPDSSGAEIARGDRSWPDEPVEPTVDPILGYGDFSGVAYGTSSGPKWLVSWSSASTIRGLWFECSPPAKVSDTTSPMSAAVMPGSPRLHAVQA